MANRCVPLLSVLSIALFFPLLFSYVAAQEESESLPAFAELPAVLPPEIPASEGISIPVVLLKLETLQRELIKNVHVVVELRNSGTGKVSKTLKYVDDWILQLELSAGAYEITLKADKLETEGSDYFIKTNLNVQKDESLTLNLFPVGSLAGVVYDKYRKVVPGAVVKVVCSSEYGDFEQKSTDSFGTFLSDSLPTGSCRLSAQHGNYVGHRQILIQHGQLADVEIALDKRLAAPNYMFYLIAAAVILIVAAAAAYFLKGKGFALTGRKVQGVKEATGNAAVGEKREKAFELSRRSNDIIKTLSDNEGKVVDFLLQQHSRGFEATQAKIFYGTGIPKTSLVRLIKALENKKIVDVKRIAKAKKVRLTPWFLSEEEPPESGHGKVPE